MDLKHHNVNNKYLTKEQFHAELWHKNHDLVCPRTWLFSFGRSYHQCITAFEGMDKEKSYVTMRSIELARRIHLQMVENGILDLEPLRSRRFNDMSVSSALKTYNGEG